jgi:hypothetical protein
VCAQVTLTKTGLFAVQTFSPLGVNCKGNEGQFSLVIHGGTPGED